MTAALRKARLLAFGLVAALFVLAPAAAQYVPPYVTVTGPLMASNGIPLQNGVVSFVPDQMIFIGGTSVVVSGSTCGTDANGNIVGLRNPLTPPVLSATYGSGTLPPANYWVVVTWRDTYGKQTLASPAVVVQLTSTGSIMVQPPSAGAPANAVGMNVYISATSSATTQYQGQTASTTATYTQSAALAAGAAPPTMNLTACQVVANDAGWPTGSGYNFSVTTAGGNTLPGYPVLVQFLGPGTTYNVSNGLPLYNGRVIYPVPILAQPYNHNPQSIAGPLAMGQTGGQLYPIYNVQALGVGTATPAYGVDVEGGTGGTAAINANQGYLVNGGAGSVGQCLASDGNYFDTPQNCVTSLPTLYYQTIASAGTGETQRPVLNFGSEFAVADSSSPARTTVDLTTQGGVTPGSYTLASLTVNAFGLVTAVSTGTVPSGQVGHASAAGCTFSSDGNGLGCGPVTVTFSPAFADTSYGVVCYPNFSSAMMTTTSALPALFLGNITVSSTSQVSVYEAVNAGSSTGYGISTSYGVTVECIAHHY